MSKHLVQNQYDFLIVGAGIIGLTLARELARRKTGRVLVLEKEAGPGFHASGRNSGVVHAGIYYAADSMKARFCADGARHLLAYANKRGLPVLNCGKVIVASRPDTVPTLSTLLERARQNDVQVEQISLTQLAKLEPEAQSLDHALWSPNTAVINPKTILASLLEELKELKVEVHFQQQALKINPIARTVQTDSGQWSYGFLCNAAGTHADKVARQFGAGLNFRILPFKGLYWKASPSYAAKIQRLIYPAPDIHMPFLGVHITRTLDGNVLFGPTAIPAFGRENYSLLGGLDVLESPGISWQLIKMLARNPANFRTFVRQELGRYWPNNFYLEAKALVKNLERRDIGDFYKVGIRAQLMDVCQGQLVTDFVVENGPHSIHVLNAISPAFTSAFAFAPFLADRIVA